MTVDARPPVAIRITRPYASEDEYLEHELDTLTRASITLVGAQPRAEGAVLRFEVVLSTGQVLLRGEGRVTGFKASTSSGVGGLSLRFTRLDTRSKALVDKAAALRERRRPSLRPTGSEPPESASVPPPIPSLLPSMPPRPSESVPAPASVRPPLVPPPIPTRLFPPPLSTPPLPAESAERLRAPSSAPPSRAPSSVPPPVSVRPLPIAIPPAPPVPRPPSDRDALLERLRARAKTLDPGMVRRLLSSRGS